MPDNIKVMGILNITPDSFSDGGEYLNIDQAIEKAKKLIDDGADILDIGGESTKPNAEYVSVNQEIERVIPVIDAIRNICIKNNIKISIDTRKSKVMEEAVMSGANIINDVSALTHDKKSLKFAAKVGIPVCLMHMQGSPDKMQKNPQYNNVIDEIYYYLKQRIEQCIDAGIEQNNIIVDPGIGFGKTLDHNLKILNNLDKFNSLGCKILLGTSRKNFISEIMEQDTPTKNRLAGSLATIAKGIDANVSIFRVHDVYETKQFIKIYSKINAS